MRNYLSKVLALSLPVILAFSIQECSNRNVPTEPATTTQPQPSEIIVYDPNDPRNPANQTQIGSESTSGNEQTTVGSGDVTQSPGGSTMPTEKAGIISMFNSALDKTSGLKRVSYTRKLTKCKIKLLGDKTNDPKVQELSAMNNTTATASDLVKLNDSMVSAATAKQSGSNYVFEITLNNKSGNQDSKSGDGGFVGIVDFAETKTLVHQIAKDALNLDVELKDKPEYEFSAGKYTVTVNSQTGQLVNVKHSFTEGGSGKVSVTSVELSIDITAEYSA